MSGSCEAESLPDAASGSVLHVAPRWRGLLVVANALLCASTVAGAAICVSWTAWDIAHAPASVGGSSPGPMPVLEVVGTLLVCSVIGRVAWLNARYAFGGSFAIAPGGLILFWRGVPRRTIDRTSIRAVRFYEGDFARIAAIRVDHVEPVTRLTRRDVVWFGGLPSVNLRAVQDLMVAHYGLVRLRRLPFCFLGLVETYGPSVRHNAEAKARPEWDGP